MIPSTRIKIKQTTCAWASARRRYCLANVRAPFSRLSLHPRWVALPLQVISMDKAHRSLSELALLPHSLHASYTGLISMIVQAAERDLSHVA